MSGELLEGAETEIINRRERQQKLRLFAVLVIVIGRANMMLGVQDEIKEREANFVLRLLILAEKNEILMP